VLSDGAAAKQVLWVFLGEGIVANIRVVLKDNARVIEGRINKAIASGMNDALLKGRSVITRRLVPMIKQWLSEQPEMMALKSGGVGSLPSQLGLVAGTESRITDVIINSISSSTHVDFKSVTSNLRQGGLIIKCQIEDFSNLLSIPQGFVEDINIAGQLHWLKWLLEEGNRAIITGYHYEPNSGSGRSRGGSMGSGSIWRVPPQYSGTSDDNFITRALANKEKHIQKLLEQVLGG
jgi:hypothetical protein